MSEQPSERKKNHGPVRRFLALTLGPRAFVAKSFGTDVGDTVKEQYQEWKQVNDVDLKEIISQRNQFDFEKKCYENRRKPSEVMAAYRNVAIIQGILWVALSATGTMAVAGTSSFISSFLTFMALLALPVMILAATHHQICIREKIFLSPGELLKFLLTNPQSLLPSPLPQEWRLYTKYPESGKPMGKRPRRKVTIKKRG